LVVLVLKRIFEIVSMARWETGIKSLIMLKICNYFIWWEICNLMKLLLYLIKPWKIIL